MNEVIEEAPAPRVVEAAWARPRLLRFRITTPWWPIVIGAFLVFIANNVELVNHAMEHAAHAGFLERVKLFPLVVFSAESGIKFLSELGFALIIAFIVSVSIEAKAHADFIKLFREKSQALNQDVFKAIYEISHDPAYVKVAIERVFQAKLARSDYEVSYRLDPYPVPPDYVGSVDFSRFLLVTVQIRYTVRNLTNADNTFDLKYGLPLRSGVFRKMARLSSLKVGQEPPVTGEALTQLLIGDDEIERTYNKRITLTGYEERDIAIDATMVKELSDTEIFSFLHPTMGLKLALTVNLPGLSWGMRPRTASAVKPSIPAEDGRSQVWRIAGPILPHNSVSLWWRDAKDDDKDGEEEQLRSDPNVILPVEPDDKPSAPLTEAVHLPLSPNQDSQAKPGLIQQGRKAFNMLKRRKGDGGSEG